MPVTTMVLVRNPLPCSFIALADLHALSPRVIEELPRIENYLGFSADIIIIAGDLASTKRHSGERKNVTGVYQKLQSWGYEVVGVLGNHDIVDNPWKYNILDGNTVEIGGLRFGGISGSIGVPWIPGRISTERYVSLYLKLVRECDVLITHEPPHLRDFSPSKHRKHIAYYLGNKTGRLKLHVYGHINPAKYGPMLTKVKRTVLLNAYRKVVVGI